MFPDMFPDRRPPPFRRGALRYLVLRILSEKSTHGYEIMKSLSEEFGGFYQPSAGAIYPVLQRLEDEGYIRGEDQEGRRVYSITPEGTEILKKNEEEVEEIIERRRALFGERRGFNRELRNLAILIMTNYQDLTPEQTERVSKILKEALRNVIDVIFE